jgi:phosphatidylserine/phosphatidylglycerophosphate/cardiolipin synthase-like enzyme
MRRFFSVMFCLGILLQACGPMTLGAQEAGRAFASPTAGESLHPGEGSGQLTEIPLHVGRGVDGGWYQLYFTDPSNPAADQLDGGPDSPLVDAMDGAKLSIDVAMYSLSLDSVRRALIRAHRRGITVRMVMESDNMDGADVQALKDAGIPILGDRRQGLMHDKFVVIDRSEVWTGSMNLTDNGAYSDRNNLLRIRDSAVARHYETEFTEMFVDDKFGPAAAGVNPSLRFTVNGTPLAVYFSPDDHVQAALLELLDKATTSIYFLGYSFTSDPLGKAIRSRAAEGITVSGIMDADQIKTNTGTEYDAFRQAGLDVRLDGEPGLMHNKVLIIDGETVVTGSYNFTASAEKTNDENLVIIRSPELAAQYYQEFLRIRALAQP